MYGSYKTESVINDKKSLELFKKEGLPQIRGENCSLYQSLKDEEFPTRGLCNFDCEIVDIRGGCETPESCSKLERINIKVKRLN